MSHLSTNHLYSFLYQYLSPLYSTSDISTSGAVEISKDGTVIGSNDKLSFDDGTNVGFNVVESGGKMHIALIDNTLSDAPNDTYNYSRLNGSWSKITGIPTDIVTVSTSRQFTNSDFGKHLQLSPGVKLSLPPNPLLDAGKAFVITAMGNGCKIEVEIGKEVEFLYSNTNSVNGGESVLFISTVQVGVNKMIPVNSSILFDQTTYTNKTTSKYFWKAKKNRVEQ